MQLELDQVAVEPLYPPELASLSVADFMAALPSLDAGFTQRVAAAAAAGKVCGVTPALRLPGYMLTHSPTLLRARTPSSQINNTAALLQPYSC